MMDGPPRAKPKLPLITQTDPNRKKRCVWYYYYFMPPCPTLPNTRRMTEGSSRFVPLREEKLHRTPYGCMYESIENVFNTAPYAYISPRVSDNNLRAESTPLPPALCVSPHPARSRDMATEPPTNERRLISPIPIQPRRKKGARLQQTLKDTHMKTRVFDTSIIPRATRWAPPTHDKLASLRDLNHSKGPSP